MDIKKLEIGRKYFAEMRERVVRNTDLAVFYDHLFFDTYETKYDSRARALRVCCKWFGVDYYRLQQVKDVKQVNLCKDKFCYNCQSILAARRYMKYAPRLDSLYSDYSVCHMVVTVPNVYGDELLPTLNRMYKRFKHLTRFLSGNACIRGMEFARYGYAGGIRALEVTYNRDERTFHPHFHVMLLLRKGVRFEGRHINQYSFDNKRPEDEPRPYSDFEIALQKIWYLLMNGETVTKEAVEAVKVGYDVHVDKVAKGDYHECFKYACKGAFKREEGDDDADIYTEEVFRALSMALENRRMLQGYGVLHNFKDEDVALLDEEAQEDYLQVISELAGLEEPYFIAESLREVVEEQNCKYISKGRFKRILIEMMKEEEEE